MDALGLLKSADVASGCKSVRGPDADRHAKLLIRLALEGSRLGAYSHTGFKAFARLFESGQCWVKLAGPYRISAAPDMPYGDVAVLAQRLARINPERLLWGTDWPHVMNKKPMPNDGDLSDLIADWLPDEALRERVLVTNPASLYGFPDGECLDVELGV